MTAILEILKDIEVGVDRNWGDSRISTKLATETHLTIFQAQIMVINYRGIISEINMPEKHRLLRNFMQLCVDNNYA